MTSRKAKGDAGEAAYAERCEMEGHIAYPLSPSFPCADLIVLRSDGTLELVEVKAWNREISPKVIATVTQTLLALRASLPRVWQRRLKLSLVHAVKGTDDIYRFVETWRFP